MSPTCNGTSSTDPSCRVARGSADTAETLTSDTSVKLADTSATTPTADNGTTWKPEEDSILWVPYLSLICLVVVFLTLAFSFLRHRKRVVKRRRNILDYLDVNIDLKRKRLYGMMRMPFDMCQESRSLSASADFSRKSGHNLRPDYQKIRQYSYELHFPQEKTQIQRGGFQRHESTFHPIPGIETDDRGYGNNPYDYVNPNASCGSQRLCHHHCIVSCSFCWGAVQNEMFHLFDKSQDYLYHKDENSPNFRFQNIDFKKNPNKTSERLKKSDHGQRSIKVLQSYSAPNFNNDGTSRKSHRSVEKTREAESVLLKPPVSGDCSGDGSGGGDEAGGGGGGDGGLPKIHKHDNGVYGIEKHTARDNTGENIKESKRQRINSSFNAHVHSSDTQLTSPTNQRPNHLHTLSRKSYKLLSKAARLTLPARPPSATTEDAYADTHNKSSASSRSVAFTNTSFQVPNSPPQPQPSESLFGNGGVINYGFQSDSTATVSHLNYSNNNNNNNNNNNSNNHDDDNNSDINNVIADASPIDMTDYYTKRTINDSGNNYYDDPEDFTTTTTNKRKKKKHFLKAHTTESAVVEATSPTSIKGQQNCSFSQRESLQQLQRISSRQSNVSKDHCIDLSVIEVDNTGFEYFDQNQIPPLNVAPYSSANTDINV